MGRELTQIVACRIEASSDPGSVQLGCPVEAHDALAPAPRIPGVRPTRRPVEAHDALAPALEVISPTPELPDIAEAQSLLEALSDTDDATAEQRPRNSREGA